MLNSMHKFFSENVMIIPFNIPFSMAMGYYVDGTKGMIGMAGLSIGDLVLKYNNLDSYYLSFSSVGYVTGQKLAQNLIMHYKCYNKKEKGEATHDKIEILDHLLPVSISAMGVIAAYAMNKIEHTVVDYINDNNDDNALVTKENDVAEILEVI
jgi:hypothetical protein